MGRPREWPDRYRVRAAELREKGYSYGRISNALGIPAATIKDWFLTQEQIDRKNVRQLDWYYRQKSK